MNASLLDLAAEQKPMSLEGGSVATAISDSATESIPRKNPIFRAHNKGRAVRSGDWKLVSEGKEEWELYHLAEDGTELNDVSAKHPGKVAELEKEFRAWAKRTDMGASKEKPK